MKTVLKQLFSHLLSGLLQSSHSCQMEKNHLSSFKKYFVYLQSRQQLQLPSICPLLLKPEIRRLQIDLEITKAFLNVLYICQSGGKITLIFFLANQTPYIMRISLWPECCGEEQITESQNVKGWKVPQGIIWSSLLAQEGTSFSIWHRMASKVVLEYFQ